MSTLPRSGFNAATLLSSFRELFVFIFKNKLVLVDKPQ